MILGIDFGSTTTKIVLMDKTEIKYMNRIDRNDSYIDEIKKLPINEISLISVVGTGASYIEGDILGIKTKYVEEFMAVSLGGHFLSGEDECLVVSLGTGTSFMYVNYNQRQHAGGSGIGGGLLQALARERMENISINEFLELADKGKLQNADLLIKDISKNNVGELYGDVTVANMAKINASTSDEDYAYGVCNLVFQNVGVMAVMASRPYNTKKIVVMGTLTQYEIAKKCLNGVGALFNCDFIIPENAGYGVVIGAVLLADPDYNNKFSIYGFDISHLDYTFE